MTSNFGNRERPSHVPLLCTESVTFDTGFCFERGLSGGNFVLFLVFTRRLNKLFRMRFRQVKPSGRELCNCASGHKTSLQGGAFRQVEMLTVSTVCNF